MKRKTLIVALAVVAIGLVALLQLQLLNVRMTRQSDDLSQAVMIAEEKINELLIGPFPKIKTATGTIEDGGRTFNWQRKVTAVRNKAVADVDAAPLRKIKVKVDWDTSHNDKPVELVTYIRNWD